MQLHSDQDLALSYRNPFRDDNKIYMLAQIKNGEMEIADKRTSIARLN